MLKRLAIADDRAGGYGELFRIAWPLVLSSGSISLMHVVDRVFLSWHSKHALAAGFSAGVFHWTIISLFMGVAAYVNTFVAQYHGAAMPHRIGAAVWQGIYFSLIAGAVLLAIAPFSPLVFAWIGHDDPLPRLEAEYFAILCFGGFPMILATALSSYYGGRGLTKVIMWVNMAASGANIVLDYFFIFGFGTWPGWGMRGAAIATVVSCYLSVALYCVLLARDADAASIGFFRNRRFNGELFRKLLTFGVPSGAGQFLEMVCFCVFVLLIGKLGTGEEATNFMASTTVAFNLNTFAFLPMLGFGTAVMVLVGQRIGEGRPEIAATTTWRALRVSVAYMAVWGVIYLFLPSLILRPYARHADPASFEQIERLTVVLLRFVALFSIFDAMAIVFGAALRGAGDTRFVLWFQTLSGVFIMVAPTYVAHRYFDGGLYAAWTAVTLYVIVLGVGFLARHKQGRWKSMRVIERAVAEPAPASSELAPV